MVCKHICRHEQAQECGQPSITQPRDLSCCAPSIKSNNALGILGFIWFYIFNNEIQLTLLFLNQKLMPTYFYWDIFVFLNSRNSKRVCNKKDRYVNSGTWNVKVTTSKEGIFPHQKDIILTLKCNQCTCRGSCSHYEDHVILDESCYLINIMSYTCHHFSM